MSIRILAYAGYDPQSSLDFWSKTPTPACHAEKDGTTDSSNSNENEAERPRSLGSGYLRGRIHDTDDERFMSMQAELNRWRSLAGLKG